MIEEASTSPESVNLPPPSLPPANPQVATKEDAVQFTHLAILAGHVDALKQMFLSGAHSDLKAVHIGAVVDHALGLANAADAATAQEPPPVDQKVETDPIFKIAAGAIIGVVLLIVSKILHVL
jgi:hypothetical protein